MKCQEKQMLNRSLNSLKYANKPRALIPEVGWGAGDMQKSRRSLEGSKLHRYSTCDEDTRKAVSGTLDVGFHLQLC